MKKTLSLTLALLLGLSLAAGASAEAWTFEEAGITLTVPEGLTAEDISEDDSFLALYLSDPAEPDVEYYYSVAYDADLEEIWTEDLSGEDLENALGFIVGNELTYTYDTVEADGVTYSVVVSDGGEEMHYIAILNGWICVISGYAAEGYTLTEVAATDMANILAGVTYAGK